MKFRGALKIWRKHLINIKYFQVMEYVNKIKQHSWGGSQNFEIKWTVFLVILLFTYSVCFTGSSLFEIAIGYFETYIMWVCQKT